MVRIYELLLIVINWKRTEKYILRKRRITEKTLGGKKIIWRKKIIRWKKIIGRKKIIWRIQTVLNEIFYDLI